MDQKTAIGTFAVLFLFLGSLAFFSIPAEAAAGKAALGGYTFDYMPTTCDAAGTTCTVNIGGPVVVTDASGRRVDPSDAMSLYTDDFARIAANIGGESPIALEPELMICKNAINCYNRSIAKNILLLKQEFGSDWFTRVMTSKQADRWKFAYNMTPAAKSVKALILRFNGTNPVMGWDFTDLEDAGFSVVREPDYVYIGLTEGASWLDPTLVLLNGNVTDDTKISGDTAAGATNDDQGGDDDLNVNGIDKEIPVVRFGGLNFTVSDAIINYATVFLYVEANSLDTGEGWTVNAYEVYQPPNFTVGGGAWTEGTGTAAAGCSNGVIGSASGTILSWEGRPDAPTEWNSTVLDSYSIGYGGVNFWADWNITDAVQRAVSRGEKNITIMFNATTTSGSPSSLDCAVFSSAEAADNRPYLQLSYTAPTPKWGLNSSNNTVVGQPTLFSVNWTALTLDSYIFQFCNGSYTGTACGGSVGWANTSCSYRKPITFNYWTGFNTTNLTNFPVMIQLNSSTVNYTLTNRTDFMFYDNDNSTLLSKETELWNASGNSYVWVKVPVLENTSTDAIWMYYSCGGVTDDSRTNVWNSNYSSVWHMNNTGNRNDSTSNANNAGIYGYDNNETMAGMAGSADYLDGLTDYMRVNASASLNMGASNFTIEVWAKRNASDGVIIMDNSNSVIEDIMTIRGNPLKAGIYMRDSGGTQAVSTTGVTTLTDNVWYYLTIVRSGSEGLVYVNGILENSTKNAALASIDSNDAWYLGVDAISGADTIGSYYKGALDEVRISKAPLTAAWINATYMTVRNAMLTIGSEQPKSTATWVNDTAVAFAGGTWSNVTKVLNSTEGAGIAWRVYANRTGANGNTWNATDTWYFNTTGSGVEYYFNAFLELFGLGDSLPRFAGTARSQNEKVVAIDTLPRTFTGWRALADVLGVRDTLPRSTTVFRVFADALRTSDAAAGVRGFTRAFAETLGLSDANPRMHGAFRVIEDMLGRIITVGSGSPVECYQEFANVSAGCGIATGVYKFVGTWTDASLVIDGDPSTYGKSDSDSGIGYLYVNYTKPVDFTNATWQHNIFHSVSQMNNSLNQTCLTADPDKLILRVEDYSNSDPANSYTKYACFNGTDFTDIYYGFNSARGGYNEVYEEGVYWMTGSASETTGSAFLDSFEYYVTTSVTMYYEVVSDVLGLSDARAGAYAAVRALADGLGLSDANARSSLAYRTLSDVLRALDLNTRSAGTARAVVDTLRMIDANARSGQFARAVSDVLRTLDLNARVASFFASIADLLGIGDGTVFSNSTYTTTTYIPENERLDKCYLLEEEIQLCVSNINRKYLIINTGFYGEVIELG